MDFSERKINVMLNRDSICMGDDIQDHREQRSLNENMLFSEFLILLADYVPTMRDIVWAVHTDNGVSGYIITDADRNTTYDLCGADKTIKELNITEADCQHFYKGYFSMKDAQSGETVRKYEECSTLLEKVKMHFAEMKHN